MDAISGLLINLLATAIKNPQKAAQLIRALANIRESELFDGFIKSPLDDEFVGLNQLALRAEDYNYLRVSSGETAGSWGEQYFHNNDEVCVVEKGRVAIIEIDGPSWPRPRVFDAGQQFIVRKGLFRRTYLFPKTMMHKIWYGRISIYPEEHVDFDRLNQLITEQAEFITSLNKKVEDLSLSNRVLKRLLPLGILYLGQLIQTPERQIQSVEGLGRKSVREIQDCLGEMGLSLDMKIEDWQPPPASLRLPIELVF